MSNSIADLLNRGLTVGELKGKLAWLPDDAYVVFEDDYGDRTHTLQALPVKEVEILDDTGGYLYETAYSGSGLAVRNAEDRYWKEDGRPADHPKVVVLR